MRFHTKRTMQNLRNASPSGELRRRKGGREGRGPKILLSRKRLHRYRGARRDSSPTEIVVATLIAAAALIFFVRMGGARATYMGSALAVLGLVGLFAVWLSGARTAAKILYSIPFIAAVLPYVPGI